MRFQRVLGLGGLALLAMTMFLVANSLSWIGATFPGFLLLENRVVASAGLSSWATPPEGSLAYHEIVSVDSTKIERAEQLAEYTATLAPGTSVAYVVRKDGVEKDISFQVERFTRADYVWFFGFYLVVGLAFAGVALSLLFLASGDQAARGSAAFLGFIGLWALTSIDLYGPHHFFRVHAFFETLVIAGTLHMALVFPSETRLTKRFRGLLKVVYAIVFSLAALVQATLYHPGYYVKVHQVVIFTMGFSWLVLVVAMLHAYKNPESLEAQQRVKVVAIALAASIGCSLVFLSVQLGGGAGTEKLLAAAIFMPISIGYAVLKDDLLEVDEFLRRSLVYAVLTALIAAFYAGSVVAVEMASRGVDFSAGWLSAVIFAGLSIFVILPVRDRVQSAVDRLFFRSAYDFRMVVEEVSGRLSRVSDLESIVRDVRSAVSESLEPTFVQLEVIRSSDEASEASGIGIVDKDDGSLLVPFQIAGKRIATMAIGAKRSGGFYSGADRALLQTLANQAALAIENALAIETVQELNRTLEARVEERTAELARAIESLKSTQVHLVQSERMAAIGELSAGVAHEVNNPLNFARNSLATLQSYAEEVSGLAATLSKLDLADEKRMVEELKTVQAQLAEAEVESVAGDMRELVGILIDALDRTAKLVADLRDFAAPARGGMIPVDIAASIQSTIQLMGHEIRNANAEVRLDLPDRLSRVGGNPAALNQVFLNLIKNALEALGPGDRIIWVSAKQADQNITVLVADSGSGINVEIAEHLFEPFFTTKGAGEGTGLGLSMCRRIIKDHKGTISIGPRNGGGAQVCLQLPAMEREFL